MPLDPQTGAFLQQLADAGARSFSDQPPQESRKAFSGLIDLLPPASAEPAVIKDVEMPGPGGLLPLRIYTPKGDGPFAVLVYVHGGGFVIGSVEDYDAVCRELCCRVGCILVSVEYRLAPEAPFPAAAEDACAALDWVADHCGEFNGDPTRLAVGGDSAGGNLAAVSAQHARDRGLQGLRAQLLVYPATQIGEETASMRDNAYGYLLTRADMDYFIGHYVPEGTDTADPRLAPRQASDFSGLAPAWVATCEYDPLRDEGEDYARALEGAGVTVKSERYAGAIHGTFSFFAVLDIGERMLDDAAVWLRQQLA